MTTLTDVTPSSSSTLAEEQASPLCHTKEAVAEMGSAMKADAQEFRYIAEDYVVEHPMKVVGIALGVGFLLGVLWSR
jgi:ElaB/YqjD/DUF883 family membrane-anchored ribosome-binding protein